MEKKYTTLRSEEIIKTLALLQNRIKERFPNSGLSEVAYEVRVTASEARKKAQKINSPHKVYRTLSISLIVGVVVLFIWLISQLGAAARSPDAFEFLQVLEASLNSLVFIGAGIIFLFSVEKRFKRHLVMTALHELRSLAHVVDMHQLTKDPEVASFVHRKTASSPKRELTPFELNRYLDYCCELLALISKIASVYVDEFPDQPSLNAVDQIQTLTNDMARKIWQKIMILNQNIQNLQQEVAEKNHISFHTTEESKKSPEMAVALKSGETVE